LIFLNNHLTNYYTMTYCLKRKNKKRFFSFQSMPNLNFAELIATDSLSDYNFKDHLARQGPLCNKKNTLEP